ncbi:MAG: hypothetical protein M2R45_05436 [Verrucomicrobia subdivision 3 bacterium]|nr:hypothetical protein [Limisphaerales bacterium]MCS1417306.1 hypothetical protein [Limisphaerales bacterium]
MLMTEPTITCPKCKEEIKLTESLAAPLIKAKEHEYEERLQKERATIAAEEEKKAKLFLATDLAQTAKENTDLKKVLKHSNEKLAEAQKAQTDFLREQRKLKDKERELDLTIEKRVQKELADTREQAKKEAEEEHSLKAKEDKEIIASLQKEIGSLKRKAEQGSQQLQGEVQELEIEALLSTEFPFDTIQPVPKGVHGGDILHVVISPLGQECGTILWESKRTKHWSDGWLAKLRDDQRAAKADLAVIVSQTLPKGIETFDLIAGVWVTHPRVALPIATMLRHTLIEIATARQASEGQQTKMEEVYQYLTGPHFRQRVEAIVEGFSSMQEDLHKERRVINKQWDKREKQLNRAMKATVGMYGDFQGIAGKTLQEIEGLELHALDAPMDEHEEL